MNNTPEQDFTAYAAGGDLVALGRVFERFAPQLQRIARRLAAGTPEAGAEDLVQMTFVTAIEKASEFDPRRSLAAWLVGILALHAKNARRKISRRGSPEHLEHDPAASSRPLSERFATESQRSGNEWSADVRLAVARAPRLYQPVLEAVLFEGCTPLEAALLLDLSPGTARQRLRRGLSLLRDALARTLGALFAVRLWTPRLSGARRTALFERAARLHPACGRQSVSRLASVGPGFALVLPVALLGMGALGWLAWNAIQAGGPQTSVAQGAPESRSPQGPASFPLPPKTATTLRRALPAGEATLDARPAIEEAQPMSMLLVNGMILVEGSGLRVAAAEIWLQHLDGKAERVATSDESGEFEFRLDRGLRPTPDPGPGAASSHPPLIEVRARGYASYRIPRGALRRALFMRREGFRDGPLQSRYSFQIRLLPAHHISGRVLDANGRGARAELFLIDAWGELAGEGSIGRTDQAGYFDLREVGQFFYKTPRPMPLVAIGPGGTGFARVGVDLPGDLKAGQLPPAIEQVEITLANEQLSVQVLDESGLPLKGALVEAKPVSMLWNHPQALLDEGRCLWLEELPEAFAERFRTWSGADGVARLEHLPSFADPYMPRWNGELMAEWVLQGSLPGYLPSQCSAFPIIERLGDGAQARRLVLERPIHLRLHGLVLDDEGKPLGGVRIYGDHTIVEIRSDSRGRWSWPLSDLRALPLKLICEQSGHASPSYSWTAEDIGGRTSILHDFRFETPVGLQLKLVDASGVPVSGVHVRIRRLGEERNGIVDMGGRYSNPAGRAGDRRLPAGLYSILIGPAWPDDGVGVESFELEMQAGEDRVLPVVVIE